MTARQGSELFCLQSVKEKKLSALKSYFVGIRDGLVIFGKVATHDSPVTHTKAKRFESKIAVCFRGNLQMAQSISRATYLPLYKPQTITLDMTDRCQLKCQTCSKWKPNQQSCQTS
jgi:ABC-type uncharacterized transport system substrate-binding protein